MTGLEDGAGMGDGALGGGEKGGGGRRRREEEEGKQREGERGEAFD